eukprot:754318-Hanusia_phi.AAC.1
MGERTWARDLKEAEGLRFLESASHSACRCLMCRLRSCSVTPGEKGVSICSQVRAREEKQEPGVTRRW